MANTKNTSKHKFSTRLKTGDTVMIVSGGNGNKPDKNDKGKVGKILGFLPKKSRVIVEGAHIVTKHKRAMTSEDTHGRITKEGSVHISNVMYYSEEHHRPFRLSVKTLEDGRKVRGFKNPETKEFEQIDV